MQLNLQQKNQLANAVNFGLKTAKIVVKGEGPGREAAMRAAQNFKLNITSIEDITAVPHNGCRPPKNVEFNINMAELKFQYTKSCVEESGNLTGHFLMPTTEPSQGLTVGNALRRVLVVKLEGTALTGINIPNAHHEFSTIEGIREDILEILLNLKQIILKSPSSETLTGRLKINGPGVITAACLEFDQPVEIINPTHYMLLFIQILIQVTNLEQKKVLVIFLQTKLRKKYEDFLNIDAVFMPVLKVNYTIKKVYVGYNQTIDSLVLEITTNGSLTPEEALSQGAKKLTNWFGMLTTVDEL